MTDHLAARPRSGAVPVVLDVDTGIDDACALLLAALHPRLDLRVVTCVAGNASLDQVVTNTLTVLRAAGAAGVPVGRGADRPLLEPHRHARHVHGEDGMGDLGWPAPAQGDLDAVRPDALGLLREVLLDAAAAGAPVTLVTLAPLTNVALLLRAHPEVAAGIERLVFMGGAAGTGNVTAAAEFNVWHDPEAAAIVLAACRDHGIRSTMYGLEVFYEPQVSLEQAAELRRAEPGTASRLAGELIAFQAARLGGDRATIGDAGAVCAVVDPDGLTTRALPVHIELAGSRTRGRTVVDTRSAAIDLDHDDQVPGPTTVEVALAVDGERYSRMWLDTVGTHPDTQAKESS